MLNLLSTLKIDPHTALDIEFYLAFVFGQALFLLKRAGSAIRNQVTAVETRKQFFACNLDIITVRMIIESILFYYPFRHYSVAQLFKLFGWDITGSESPWLSFLITVPSSAISAVALGYAADSFLDGLSQWSKLPDVVKRWLKENVPTLASASPSNSQDAGQNLSSTKPNPTSEKI